MTPPAKVHTKVGNSNQVPLLKPVINSANAKHAANIPKVVIALSAVIKRT